MSPRDSLRARALTLSRACNLTFLRLDIQQFVPDVRLVFHRNLLLVRQRCAVIRPDRSGKLPQGFPPLLQHVHVLLLELLELVEPVRSRFDVHD